jgi:hypothetical protein
VPGQTVIQQVELLYEAGVVDTPLPVTSEDPPAEASAAVAAPLESQGWREVDETAPEFGQAEASAAVFLEEEDAFAPGEFDVTAVFEVDPPDESAYPKLFGRDELDQVAFFHEPYYTLVEVAPFEPLLTEPGRAPTTPEVDDSRPRQYVFMVRDLGSLREPAAYITLGSGIVFFAMVFFLNRRDRIVAVNLERKAVAAA